MPTCSHPECTGVHDNNRFSELCPRSRAAKRIKDSRYINNDAITEGRLTKGDVARRHRWRTAAIHRFIKAYGTDSEYARLAGEDRATSRAGRWETEMAGEIEKFRARREGHRGTRRKIDTICMGGHRTGLITVTMVIAATRNPDLRTYYR